MRPRIVGMLGGRAAEEIVCSRRDEIRTSALLLGTMVGVPSSEETAQAMDGLARRILTEQAGLIALRLLVRITWDSAR